MYCMALYSHNINALSEKKKNWWPFCMGVMDYTDNVEYSGGSLINGPILRLVVQGL